VEDLHLPNVQPLEHSKAPAFEPAGRKHVDRM
jgi:hypothetical protein